MSVILVSLTSAYDTVWYWGLVLKMLWLIPDGHLVKFLEVLISDSSFVLKTSDGQTSRLGQLKNGVTQGFTLAPILFNIYIHDIPATTAKMYGYADDLALLYADKEWEEVGKT